MHEIQFNSSATLSKFFVTKPPSQKGEEVVSFKHFV